MKSHESFTYVSPDVFFVLYKTLIFNILQEIVRVSFSAPNASRECGAFLFVRWLVCAARLVYKSRLYRKTSAERLSLVQVSRIKPIIRSIPENLSIKPRPETHFGAQARLVHHFVGSARQIHLGALFLFGQMTYIYIDKSGFDRPRHGRPDRPSV